MLSGITGKSPKKKMQNLELETRLKLVYEIHV